MLVGALLWWALGALAWANGGPFHWTDGSPWGEPTLRDQVPTELAAEDLRLTLTGPDTYSAQAVYTLRNRTDAPERVRLAAPIAWHVSALIDDRVGGRGPRPPSPELAKQVRFSLAAEGAATVEAPCTDMERSPPSRAGGTIGLTIQAHCTATVVIPSGLSTLTMRYEGQLAFWDLKTSKSPLATATPAS